MFEKQFEGAKLPPNNGRGMGAILPSEDEWYTHPELEALYSSRQTPPAIYDATALGKKSHLRSCYGYKPYKSCKQFLS